MKLNHLDLQVSDIHAARTFFETHFGLRCSYTRGNEIALLEDDIGFSLGLSNGLSSAAQSAALTYPPDFHIGFVLEDASQVESLYGRLQREGIAMKYTLREGGPNLFFTCFGPDGIAVEVRAPRK